MNDTKPQPRDENGRFYKNEEIQLAKPFVIYTLGICLLTAIIGGTI